MKTVLVLFIMFISFNLFAYNDDLALSSDGYQTRYFYKGFFDKDKKKWFFSNPKSLFTYEKGGQGKTKPLFQDDETVFIVTYNDKGQMVRVLKLHYWIHRDSTFRKPIEKYIVEHYNRHGEMKKRAKYIENIGMKHLTKVEFYDGGKLSSEEFYRNGKKYHTENYDNDENEEL